MSFELDLFNTDKMASLERFAEIMSRNALTIPAHLQGNVGDCLAILIQSQRWGMDFNALAASTFVIDGKLGYDAKVINSVVTSSSAIHGHIHYEYSDGWQQLAGQFANQQVTKYKRGGGTYQTRENVPTWDRNLERELWVKVGAVLANGDGSIVWGEKLYLASIQVRNSPLWVTNPSQQLAYQALKYFVRLYCPHVLLGIYDKEALQEYEPPVEKEINQPPAKQAPSGNVTDINAILAGKVEPVKETTPQATSEPERALTPYVEVFDLIKAAKDYESYSEAAEAFTHYRDKKALDQNEVNHLLQLITAKHTELNSKQA